MLAPCRLGDEHVRRLDVAVHETLLVCSVEGLCDLREKLDSPLWLQRAVFCNELGEVVTLDVAHGEKEQAVLISRLVDGDDVRMVERGRDLRLAEEALAEALVLGELGRDDLERDLAPETLLLGTVDGAHPPSADERFDLIAGDRRSGRQHGARDETHRASVCHGRCDCNVCGRMAVARALVASTALAAASRLNPGSHRSGTRLLEIEARRTRLITQNRAMCSLPLRMAAGAASPWNLIR